MLQLLVSNRCGFSPHFHRVFLFFFFFHFATNGYHLFTISAVWLLSHLFEMWKKMRTLHITQRCTLFFFCVIAVGMHGMRCIFHVILNRIINFKVIHNKHSALVSAFHFCIRNRLDFQSIDVYGLFHSIEWHEQWEQNKRNSLQHEVQTTFVQNLAHFWSSACVSLENFWTLWKFNQVCVCVGCVLFYLNK